MICGRSMGRKKKQKKFDKTKAMKRLARDTFMDIIKTFIIYTN